jgi:multiple sugar transport system permease protein
MIHDKQDKFGADKKIGLSLIALGTFLLILAFLSIPLKWGEQSLKGLLIAGCASFIASAPLMWKKGVANIRSGKSMPGNFLRIKQSGFFDFLVLFLAIGLILIAIGGIGKFYYQSTLDRHIKLANLDGSVSTLEEARKSPAFIEYNFAQDLNTFSKNYHAFFMAGVFILLFFIVCFLYMRFVSPIVAADDSLRAAHKLCRRFAQTFFAVIITLVMLFPIYWMIISSFKTSNELLASVPTLWPKNFVWENYPNVLERAPFARYLINTLVTTCIIMLTEVTVGVLAAYGFSKGRFKGQNILFMMVLGALMVPIQVTFVPIYVLIARLNAIDTYLGIILPSMVSAYFIFMLRQNFMAVDDSYIEAGKLDGMGRFNTIIHVLCPMCMPTLITVSIISFINGWNSYFWPKMVTKTAASRTIAVGVQQLKNTFAGQEVSNYNEIMAGAVMAIIPIVILFLFLQKYIMTGMSKAAMK